MDEKAPKKVSMKLDEALRAVKDETLPLAKLEELRDDLIHLLTELRLERAKLKKLEAMYFLESKESSIQAKKYAWRATPEGQRLIEVDAYIPAVNMECDGLQSRIYAAIR